MVDLKAKRTEGGVDYMTINPKGYLDAIGDTAERAVKLTSQLLAFARRQTLRPQQFDVTAALVEIREMLATLLGSRISLRVEAPANPCFIVADRSQFETAIINLAINARDAMQSEGAIVIGVAAVSDVPAQRKQGSLVGDYVAVSVSDRGLGIAAENLDRIFESFFTIKMVGSGTGLGLFASDRLRAPVWWIRTGGELARSRRQLHAIFSACATNRAAFFTAGGP